MRQVDEFVEQLPADHAEMAQRIRQLLISEVPYIEERFSFKLPFYHYFGMFCYISRAKDGISLTFCRGKDLVDEFPQLERKDRAVAASVTIRSLKDIDRYRLREVISTAAAWNEEAKRLKIPMVTMKKKSAGKKRKN